MLELVLGVATGVLVGGLVGLAMVLLIPRNPVRDIDREVQMFNAVRDARVLARKTSALLRHHERVPADLALAIDALAGAIGVFADDLSEQDDFDEARGELVQAARMASLALPEAATMNSASIAAQVRSLAADLLYASGYSREEIDERLDFD